MHFLLYKIVEIQYDGTQLSFMYVAWQVMLTGKLVFRH